MTALSSADLFSAEVLKLRTLRLTAGLTGAVLALSAIIGVAMTQAAHRTGASLDLSTVARGPVEVAWFFILVVAVVAGAGEFQHRTMRMTLLHQPVRARVLLAKGAATAAFGAGLATVAALVGVAAGAATAAVTSTTVQPRPVAVVGAVLVAAVVGALWALAGTGLGMLTRNTTLALVTVLLWRLLLEGLLPSAIGARAAARWLPGAAADATLGIGDVTRLGVLTAGGVFASYALVLLAAAVLPFLRRDVA